MADIKDIGAVHSKNGVEIRVGFESGFDIFSRSVFFRFPKGPWRMFGDTKVVKSEEAINLMRNIFRERVVTIREMSQS